MYIVQLYIHTIGSLTIDLQIDTMQDHLSDVVSRSVCVESNFITDVTALVPQAGPTCMLYIHIGSSINTRTWNIEVCVHCTTTAYRCWWTAVAEFPGLSFSRPKKTNLAFFKNWLASNFFL